MANNNNFFSFLVIWLGDFISTIGSGLTTFCLGVYMFQHTRQVTNVSMVYLASFLPALLFRPLGGIWADRIDRLALIILGNLGSTVGIGIIFFAMAAGSYNIIIIYTGVAWSAVFFAFQNPAYKASVSDFMPEKYYSRASGLMQLSNTAQYLISPLLGALMLALMDIRYILMVDMLTFIFSAISVVLVRLSLDRKLNVYRGRKKSIFIEMHEGCRAIFANRGLVLLITIVSLMLFYIGLFQVLLVPMVLSFTTAINLGISQSICSIGMLISSFLIIFMRRKRKNALILANSLALIGLCYSFIGIKPNIWTIIFPGFFFFLSIPYLNSSIDVLIRKNIDTDKQGRVWSMVSILTYLGLLLAYLSAGFLADKIFNPMLMIGGLFSNNLGYIFGIGKNRGIALMFFISGMLMLMLSSLVFKSKSIWKLDAN